MMRAGSFFAVSLWTTCFVACGAFEIEDTGAFGDGGRTGVGVTDAGPEGDGAVKKPDQPDEKPPPPGCNPGDVPHTNAMCISVATGVFVDGASKASIEDGSMEAPFKHIQAAVDYLDNANDGRRSIYVTAETYDENVYYTQRSFKFFGGLTAGSPSWSAGPNKSILAPAAGIALDIADGAQQFRIEDFVVRAVSPESGSRSTIALRLTNVGNDESAWLARVTIEAGSGLDGKQAENVPWNTGGAPGEKSSNTLGFKGIAGAGGGATCSDGTDVSGGDGAGLTVDPPFFRENANSGRNSTQLDGRPGSKECGDPARSGADGTDRSSVLANGGAAGMDAPDEGWMDFTLARWLPSDGSGGSAGVAGGGGGGGGQANPAGTQYGGGGGGAGGCGGAPSAGGGGGGASIAIQAILSTITFEAVALRVGSGGAGMPGGPAKSGSLGGEGGAPTGGSSCLGGKGGKGGNGGSGTAGGGGAGGIIAGVLTDRAVIGIEEAGYESGGAGKWGGNAKLARGGKQLLLDANGRLAP